MSTSPPPGRKTPQQRPASGRTQPTKKQARRTASRTPVKVQLRPWWQSPAFLGGGGAAVVVIIVVVLIVVASRGGGGGGSGSSSAVPASVLSAVTSPSQSLLTTVGTGGQTGQLKKLPTTASIKDSSGKPQVVYVGEESCPYCGATRWPMIMALSRFGSFSGLQETTSSSTDVYPNTHTFTFVNSTYTSKWVDFQPTEVATSTGQPLQSPSAAISQIFTTIDKPPYTGEAEAFPFLDIGGMFSLYETIYSPQLLQGLNWQQIASDISQPSSPVGQAIVGNANVLTGAICLATGNQPASVCSTPLIQGIEATLNAMPVA